MDEDGRRSELENDLLVARARYKLAVERFELLYGSIPSPIPEADGCKQIEMVALERRMAVREVAEAARRWTDFLLEQSRIHLVRDSTDP
jgi:hypothetical protein